MIKNLLDLLEKIETGIGNKASVGIRRYDNGLEFRIFWPDGFVMSYRPDVVDLDSSEEEALIFYIIYKAKQAHPNLAPLIS